MAARTNDWTILEEANGTVDRSRRVVPLWLVSKSLGVGLVNGAVEQLICLAWEHGFA